MLNLNIYQFNENTQYVVPAGIAGIQKPGMARLRLHPCVLGNCSLHCSTFCILAVVDTGSPCRYDVLFKWSDGDKDVKYLFTI